MSKRDKRKIKQAAKKEKAKEAELTCNVCKETFEARNALFKHIKDTGHARAI